MPRCYCTVARALDEYMVVEKPRGRRSHQASCDFGGRRFKDECAKFRDALPVAQVLEERRRSILLLVFALQLAGVRHYLRYALRQRFDPVSEDTSQYHDPVFLKVGGRRIINVHICCSPRIKRATRSNA